MTKYAILGVEGPHDQAFVGKVLQEYWGFSKFDGKKTNLDPFWHRFIPTYPKHGNLYKRLDMPAILSKEPLSVAIYVGEGSNLGNNLDLILENNPPYQNEIFAFGLIVDSDTTEPSEDKAHWKRFDLLKAHVATVVSVLKPGKTNTVSIADNNWITYDTLTNLNQTNRIILFLQELLDLE